METTGYMKVYFDTVMNEMSDAMNLEGMDKDHRREIGESILNTAFDKEGPRSARRANDNLTFISEKLFKPSSEIFANIEALENIAVYARSFPYRRQGISRVDYLKYHIENYLNEIYILKNRLIAFLNLVDRAYRKCDRRAEIKANLSPLYGTVHGALEGYVNVRGSHVHQNRYTDSDFDRLTTLNLLSMSGDDDASELFRNMFYESYRITRRKWTGKIKNDLSSLETLLDLYYASLTRSLIKEGKIVYPSNVHWL